MRTGRQAVFRLDHLEDFRHLVQKLLLLLLLHVTRPTRPNLSKHLWNLLPEIRQQQRVGLRHTSTPHQIVDLAEQAISGKTSQIGKEIHLLHCKQIFEVVIAEWLVPEGAKVHSRHLRVLDHSAQRPHQRSIARIVSHTHPFHTFASAAAYPRYQPCSTQLESYRRFPASQSCPYPLRAMPQ